MFAAAALFWISVAVIYTVYDGYLRMLQLWARLVPMQERTPVPAEVPFLSVIVTAYNEGHTIADKIRNILTCPYPRCRLEVIVASDGSTDETEATVTRLVAQDERIRLVAVRERRGVIKTMNRGADVAQGDVLLFTDTDTRFEPQFLQQATRPFADPKIGGATGHLLIRHRTATGVAASKDLYWSYELKLRRLETQLGLLAVCSGACMLVRKELYRPQTAAYGGDCTLPLDVISQGFSMAYPLQAIAYDYLDHEPRSEFRSRVRMTVRNWQGTWSYRHLLNPLRYPGYAWALWCHKVLRWLSPFFLLAATASVTILASGSPFYSMVALGFFAFYLAAILGSVAERWDLPIPLVRPAFSFALSQVGFAVGVLSAIAGQQRITWKG